MARAKGPEGHYSRHDTRGDLPAINDMVARWEDQLRRQLAKQKPPTPTRKKATSPRVSSEYGMTECIRPRLSQGRDKGNFKPAPFKWSKEEE